MTYKEFTKLPWKWQCHISFAYEHTETHACEHSGRRYAICDHVPYRNGAPKGRAYRHYSVDGKIYKTKEKLIEAIKDL